jgi:hypothetical protein
MQIQDAHILRRVAYMQQNSQKTHDDLLEWISGLSDGAGSDLTASVRVIRLISLSIAEGCHHRAREYFQHIKTGVSLVNCPL